MYVLTHNLVCLSRSLTPCIFQDDDSGMGGSATSAVLARSGDTDKIIEGLQAQRDKLEIEREQLEQMLSEGTSMLS